MGTIAAPTADISLEELNQDPFAVYGKLRSLGRVVWFPAIERYAVTHYDDIIEMDRQPEVFTTQDMDSPMVRSLGDMLMSKDGEAHTRERSACEGALKPRVILDKWAPQFQRNADDLIDRFVDRGHADLATEFGAPLASRNIAHMVGLPQVSDERMLAWCRGLIAGCANYAQDPDVWEANDEVRAEILAAVEEVYEELVAKPDASVIGAMLDREDPLGPADVAKNAGVIIAGGINEPNHGLAIALAGLLTNPDQRAQVEADEKLWPTVFEEAVRWTAPIGGYPRIVAGSTELAGTQLKAGDRIMAMIASSGREEDRFAESDSFNINRERKPHLAFGSGSHMCLGMWMARNSIGMIALPTLFRRLPNLQLETDPDSLEWFGWMFRGIHHLPVTWNT